MNSTGLLKIVSKIDCLLDALSDDQVAMIAQNGSPTIPRKRSYVFRKRTIAKKSVIPEVLQNVDEL